MSGDKADLLEYFSNKHNCYKDISEIRKLYKLDITQEQADKALKSLLLMFLYCPKELSIAVEATIQEFEYRMKFIGITIKA